jgi:hypothetical protein
MKINPVMVLISLAVSALAGYGFYAWNSAEIYHWLLAIGGGILIFIPLAGLLAITSDGDGTVANIRALSVVFLIVEIVSNVIFSFMTLTKPTAYIIVNGIFLLIYILIAYAVSRALK